MVNLFLILDIWIFVTINLANVFAGLMFIGRVKKPIFGKIFTDMFVILGVPLILIIIFNLILLREWWYWIYPSILFMVIVAFLKKVNINNLFFSVSSFNLRWQVWCRLKRKYKSIISECKFP